MAVALYYGEPIAIHVFRQDAAVAKVSYQSPFSALLALSAQDMMSLFSPVQRAV